MAGQGMTFAIGGTEHTEKQKPHKNKSNVKEKEVEMDGSKQQYQLCPMIGVRSEGIFNTTWGYTDPAPHRM